MTQANRIKSLRSRLGWTQLQMAEYLGLNRSRVSHMENGQEPTGPVSKLLDQLAARSDIMVPDHELALEAGTPSSSGTRSEAA